MNLSNKIVNCDKCHLCNNQRPLIDKAKLADVMWVGLSAKRVNNPNICVPLDINTNSGVLLKEIEVNFPMYNFYRTNLVKCLPLDEKNKIRYPNDNEMSCCINNLLFEIEVLKPKIVFLLGNLAFDFVTNYLKSNNICLNIKIVKVKHPSYICVYRKKYKDEYIDFISNLIRNEL